MQRQQNSVWRSLVQMIAVPVLFVICLCVILSAVGTVENSQQLKNEKQIEDTIKKAVVNCYAIEGRYPATLTYVEDYYGLQIDREKYDVFYEVFADNIMPEITVLPK